MRAQKQRLDRLEASIAGTRYHLVLDDGSSVYLERAADVCLLMTIVEAQAEAYESQEPQAVVEHPYLELFARSVPRRGEGVLAATARQWSREYLSHRKATS